MRDSKNILYSKLGVTPMERQYGGGLDDAYMNRRRSSAFAAPDATSAFASPMSKDGLPTIYREQGGPLPITSVYGQGIPRIVYRDVGGGIGDDYAAAAGEYEAAYGPADPGNVDPNEGLYDSTPELAFGAGQVQKPSRDRNIPDPAFLGESEPQPFIPTFPIGQDPRQAQVIGQVRTKAQGMTPEEKAANAGRYDPYTALDQPYFTNPSSTNIQNFIARQQAEAALSKAEAEKGQAIADKPNPNDPVEMHLSKVAALGRNASRSDPNAVALSNTTLFNSAKIPGGLESILNAANRGEYGRQAANLEVPQEVLNQISKKTGGGLPTIYRQDGGGMDDDYTEDELTNIGGSGISFEDVSFEDPYDTGPDVTAVDARQQAEDDKMYAKYADAYSNQMSVEDPDDPSKGYLDSYADDFGRKGFLGLFGPTRTRSEALKDNEAALLNDYINRFGGDVGEKMFNARRASPEGFQNIQSSGGRFGDFERSYLDEITRAMLDPESALSRARDKKEQVEYWASRKESDDEDKTIEFDPTLSNIVGKISNKFTSLKDYMGEDFKLADEKTIQDTADQFGLVYQGGESPWIGRGISALAPAPIGPLMGLSNLFATLMGERVMGSLYDPRTGKSLNLHERGKVTAGSPEEDPSYTPDNSNYDVPRKRRRQLEKKKVVSKKEEKKKDTTKKTGNTEKMRASNIDRLKSYMNLTGKNLSNSKQDLAITDISITEEDFT